MIFNVQKHDMKGQVNIPKTIFCKFCKVCGGRPVIELAAEGLYIVKCPNDDGHYQTRAGLIDIEDWNRNNTVNVIAENVFTSQISY